MAKHRIEGYDGDYKTRDMTASASGGHRIFKEVGGGKSGLKAALAAAEEWAAKNPPQVHYGGKTPYLTIYEITAHSNYAVARWEVIDNAWKRTR